MSMGGAGAAANIVGGELSGWASLLDKWAMQKAYKDELAQQAAYRNQATGVFNKNLPSFGSDAAKTQISQGAANRLQQYQAANKVPLGIQQPNQGGKYAAADTMRANMLAAPRAAYGGYGDWQQDTAMTGLQEGRDLNQISNFAGGNAAVFPYMMYDAQHSWDQLAEIGAAISSIGGGAANYAQFSQPPQKTVDFSSVSQAPMVDYPTNGGDGWQGGYGGSLTGQV